MGGKETDGRKMMQKEEISRREEERKGQMMEGK